eukprot:TRINITY_DN165_c0_g1_i10.p1 TRINITY_DN165_c0_g1~~TRINITY_DN165_c0_g1_i10.p1  ORF type:complete len:219 (+),score=72.85 TRINITY_DN165_c0_g1_i10:150-806(+)
MSDRTLYWIGGSPYAWAVSLALEYKGLEYEHKLLSASDGELKTPEFLALNPRGKVPVLVDQALAVYESQAIIMHLELSYPDKPSLLPKDKALRAKALTRANEIQYLTAAAMALRPLFGGGEVAEEVKSALVAEVRRWEAYALESSRESGFLVGDAFSVADANLIPYLALLKRFGFNFSQEKFPALALYLSRHTDCPHFQRLYPPHWKESDDKTWLADL